MLKYLIGICLNLFNKGVSKFALIDYKSKVNKKAKINRYVKFYNSTIGPYSYVGPNSKITYADIGKFCSIADNCLIGLATHSLNNISTSPIFTSKRNGTGTSWTQKKTFIENHRVTVGNDVWIGNNVIILGNIKIGNGVIIGAGAIVTRDIPDYAIAVGVPAKVIKYRFDKSIIEKLTEMEWWNEPTEKLKKHIDIFQKENFSLEDLNKF